MVLKRKISSHVVCIDPKKTNAVPKKPPTKADLVKELKSLKLLNVALEEENKKHLNTIKGLEEIMQSFQKQKLPVPSNFAVSQTFSAEDIQVPCNTCIYVATCEEELKWHMEEEHGLSSDLLSDFPCEICGKWCKSEYDLTTHMKQHDASFKSPESDRMRNEHMSTSCNFCDENFETKKSLMIHTKKEHKEKVDECWNYSAGTCVFGEEICWFIHSEKSSKSEFLGVKCKVCGKEFENKNNLLHHKKREHVQTVQNCKHYNDKACPYGDQNCWFRHEGIEDNFANNEMTLKIFKMMENFTQRIVDLEKLTEQNIMKKC